MALTVSSIAWRGQSAWRMHNANISVVLTKVGGHIAAITSTTDNINPMWQPKWEAASPETIPHDGAKTKQPGYARSLPYGGDHDSQLLAGIVGHNLCIDRFGAAWPGEKKPIHGEAGVLPWSLNIQKVTDTEAEFNVMLPEAGLDIARTFKFSGNDVIVTTQVKPTRELQSPQEIEWCEHATMGDPFLDGVEITAGVDAAWTWPEPATESWRFREHGPLASVPVQAALSMPAPADVPAGDIITTRVTDGWFEARNEKMKKLLRYDWDRNDFPWLCLWTEHKSRHQLPWAGRERTRGMEFSSKPFPEGKPPVERQETFQGTPTTMRVPQEGKTTVFKISWRDI